MELSRSLLKEFAEVTAVKSTTEKPTYLRGTITSSGTAKYVRIDGSESLTPIGEIVDAKVGDRVLVSIENHQATVVGNITKPPSAYKEEEAIAKSEEAKEEVNTALEKAETAHTLAKSAGDKADAAVVDATNASSIANQAKHDASEAITAAGNASKNSTEAKQLATAAGQNAATAREEAALAQNAATAAQGEVTRIEGIVTDVKGDIDTALKEVADQAADLQATKETLEVTYAKKTEVSDVQAALTTEISKKVGELQTTVSQTYAAKNDVVAMEGRLQSQITQTSGEVSSVVGKVEQLESDTTEAQKKVDEALEKSAAAQVAAGQAQANATAAQTAADAAKANADNATKKANAAVQNAANAAATAAEADRKVSAAKTDLAEAKVNLENTMNRVGATEQEIADAQKKVNAAQAAVTQAQKEAAEATLAANNAQSAANKAQTDATEAQNAATNAQKKADNAAIAAGNAQAAADKAQQDVAALTKRVTVAETSITQNAEQIKLAATKSEEIGNKIDNLQVGGENLFIDAAFRNKILKTDNVANRVPGVWNAYNNDSSYKFVEYNNQINYLQLTSKVSENLGMAQFYNTDTLQKGKEYCIRVFTMCEDADYKILINLIKIDSSGSYNWYYKKLLDNDVKASTDFTERKVKFTVPADDDAVMYGISIINSGTASSGGHVIKFVKPKLEEGNTFTDFSISSKDMATKDELTNNYYSKTQTDAAIKVAADNVTTTVRKEVTTVNNKLDSLQVGGRNLLKYTASDSYNKKITKDTTNNIARTLYLVDDFDLNNLINKTVVLSFRLKNYGNSEKLDNGNETWLDSRFGARMGITWKNSSTGQTSGAYPMTELLSQKVDNKRVYSTFTFTPPNSSYDTLSSVTIAMQIGYKPAQDNNSEWFLGEFKLEIGNKPTDWTPAPEDMATEGEVQQAQNTANEANGKADATEERVSVAESTLKQLSDSISMLVTDSNGSSMMTQTSGGWTFNIGAITDAIDNASNNIDSLTSSLSQANHIINNLNNLANDLSKKTAYINMTTDDTGSPCIELGKVGNAFKVRITNTSVDFIEGSLKIAYVSNHALFIERAIIKNELQIGESHGFIWKTRSNGNLGLRWFG